MGRKLRTLGQVADYTFKHKPQWMIGSTKHTGWENNPPLIEEFFTIIPASTPVKKVDQATMNLVRDKIWEKGGSDNKVNKVIQAMQTAMNFCVSTGQIDIPNLQLTYVAYGQKGVLYKFEMLDLTIINQPIFSPQQILDMYDMAIKLSQTEGQRFENCADTIVLSGFTGLGWSEYSQLKSCDIFLHEKPPEIRVGYRRDFRVKKNARKRAVPLVGNAEMVIPILRKRIMNTEGDPDVLLFGDDWWGYDEGQDQHRRVFEHITNFCGLTKDSRGYKRTPYNLRHSYCTNTYRETQNAYQSHKLMGHSQMKTTERYLHLVTEDLAQGLSTYDLVAKAT